MRRALLTGALLIALAASGFLAWRARLGKPLDLRVYFTCDVRGRLVPCGCFTGQMGGLTRVATMIGQERGTDVIKVDVGDAIAGPADYQRIQHRYLLKAFQQIGYDAANLGHAEAELSAGQLRELKASAPVPLLSANLLDKATGAPLFPTHLILHRAGRRIALIGVMDSHVPADGLGEGLRVEPIDAALGRLVPALRKEADCIIVLAFADEAELHRIAREFYEVDAVLGGKVAQPAQHLEQENRTAILYVTNQSRALGSLRLSVPRSPTPAVPVGEVTLVHFSIPEAPDIQKLAAEYRREIRNTKLAIDDPGQAREDTVPGIRAASTFVGSETCVTCHTNTGNTWQHSLHARAFDALVQVDADADPNCIACHSVGFGTATGYRRAFAGKRLANVGCESCHGPGSAHSEQRRSGAALSAAARFRPLGAGDCQSCHHGEFSRPFEWEPFWEAIQHGKETRAAR